MNPRLLPALLLWLAAAAQVEAVEVIGHRGRTAPTQVENSLRRMQATATAGFGIELDLRRSRDGTLWVLHDATLDRSTDGHGAIAERSDAELARVRLRTPDGHVTEQPLPRFDALAAWWAARAPLHARMMLDLKDASAAEVRPLLQRHGLVSQAILLTFERAQAEEALRNGGGAPVSVLVTRAQDIADYRRLAAGRPLALYLPQRSPPALFRAARASGLATITDALTTPQGESLDARAAREGCAAYAAFLATHPVDVLVSDTPPCVAAGTARAGPPAAGAAS
ncbi:MAG: glycerophosphodiester phosphodiesterase family protein [Pseudoxanthomonas sp.]